MKYGYIGYIPANIRYDKNLTPRDKLVFCEITATLDENGICTKNNIHFAKMLDTSKNTISTSITNLRKCGYISVLIEKEEKSQKFIKRYISTLVGTGGYTDISGGVDDANSDPYTENLGGVSAKNATTDTSEQGGYPEKSNPTIINNSITYKYSDKRHLIKLHKMTDEQKDYLFGIVEMFYNNKRQIFPELIKKDWASDENTVNGAINTLFELIRKDNWGESVIRDVIRWSLDDPFWSKNTLSIRSLRDKSRNGHSKFANMYAKYKK